MFDYQRFATRKQAEEEIKALRGWIGRAVRVELPVNDGYAMVWVIECRKYPGEDLTRYLRTDGGVR